MKKIILAGLLCFLFAAATYAQVESSDSISLSTAAKKRSMTCWSSAAKSLGSITKVLSQHTGIFGLQTKKDIKRSNDILMDIVKTDNDIYDQLKILLNYKTFQQTQAQDKAKRKQKPILSVL